MKDESNINIWGAPVAATPTNSPSPAAPHLAVPTNPKGTRRIRWNMWDALLGFGLMIGTQVIVSIGFVIYLVFDLLNDVELEDADFDTIADKVFNSAMIAPLILAGGALMYLSWWIAMRVASKRRGIGSYAKEFWLRFRWGRDIPLGLGIALALRVLEQGVFWVLENVAKMDLEGLTNTDFLTPQTGVWFFLTGIVMASIAGPFFEEVFFRGLVMQSVIRGFGRVRAREGKSGRADFWYRHRVKIAVLISSVAFGFMHFQGDPLSIYHWIVVVHTGIIGLILALITLKTRRLGLAIMIHIFFNFSGIVYARLVGAG